RIAQGRLSELTGEKGLAIDRFVRTLELRRRAAGLEPKLEGEIQRFGQRYLDGVNFNIKTRKNLPLEFALMGFSPEEWNTRDLLTLVHLMVWDMHYNFKSELIYHEIRAKLGEALTRELLPFMPVDEPSITGLARGGALPGAFKHVMAVPDSLGFRSASNNWAVSGSLTKSGKPMLVEDPHGHNPPVPSIFYAVHLKCPGWDIFGLSAPGLPFFQHGYNRHVAYGSTTAGTDIQDLYIEKLDPDNPDYYLHQGRRLKLEITREKIKVKDKKAPAGFREEELTIRRTLHGPLISDAMKGMNDALALRWFAIDERIIKSMKLMAESRSCRDFARAAELYVSAGENFLCADANGDIAYVATGYYPTRKEGPVRWLPAPGWTGENEWRGGLYGAALPRVYNPARGFLASANNRITGPDSPVNLDGKIASRYRFARIVQLLEGRKNLTAADMKAMMGDATSLLAKKLTPLYLQALEKSRHPRAREALALLKNWDGAMDRSLAAPTIFHRITMDFMKHTLAPRLGEELAEKYLAQWYLAQNRWLHLLERGAAEWFDDPATPRRETKEDVLEKAVAASLDWCAKRYGHDMKKWDWGRVHHISYSHTPMGKAGPVLAWIFNLGPFPFAGDMETVHRGSYGINKPFDVNNASSFRLLVDFSRPDMVSFTQSNGQVEHLWSPYRTVDLKTMLAGELNEVSLEMERVRREADGVTVLRP
ncbi:MAG TPA: penicillin acylase family protein, partial [Spirochaetes bacterium]|nr:penicillin acylase family protein [Spirochaetota bacterium]